MGEKKNPIEVFDYMYTSNHIQIMKIALPYLSTAMQPVIAVLIKFMELSYTLSLLKQPLFEHANGSINKQNFNCFFKDISKYLTEDEKKQINQIQSLMQGMEQYQQMQNIMKTFDAFSNDKCAANDSSPDFNNFSMSDNIMSMFNSAPSDAVTKAINDIFKSTT